MLHFLNMIPAIQSLGYLQGAADGIFNAAQSPAGLLATTFATQGTTAAVGAVLQNAGKTFINPEKIEAEAGESIDRIIASESNSESLAGIYATDEFNGNQELQRDLYREIEVAVSKERWKFHDDKTTAGLGFGTNVASHIVGGFGSFLGMHNVINAGVHLTMGAIKNSEAVGKISGAMDRAIKNLKGKAMSSGEMLERLLTKNVGTGNEGRELYEEFRAQGYVANGEIDYKNCDKLVGVKLSEKFADYRDAIVGNCKRVAELLLNPRSFDELKAKYVSALKGLKIDIQKSEILAPAAQALASQFGQVVGEKVGQQAYAKGKAGVGGQTREANQEEIAKKSGLNRKPSEKETGQGETPGWTPVEREVLIAKDGGLGALEEGQNVRYTTSKVFTEINGKIYEVSTKSMEILGADGSTVLKREIYGQGIEVKGDVEGIGISFGEFRDGVLIGNKLEAESTFDRFSFHEKIDLANNFHEQKLDHWNSQEGNPANWNDGFNFDMKLPKAPREVVRDGAKISKDNLNGHLDPIDQMLPEPKPKYYAGRGMIGVGLLSIEDGKLINDLFTTKVWPKTKEFVVKTLKNPRVQGSLELADGIAEMFVGAGIAVGTGVSVVGLAGGVLIVLHGASQASKGLNKIWTNEEVESVTAIALQQLGMPKDIANTVDDMVVVVATLGGAVIVRKITERTAEQAIKEALKESGESLPMVTKTDVCPREIGLGEKLDLKLHSPVDGGDWGNIKQQALRNDIIENELRNTIEYDKLKNELLQEVHIGHGNLKLLAENGLSIKDVEKFGGNVINDLISENFLKEAFSNWGIGKDGTNQLLDHTIGKEIGRISKIAERAGLDSSELTGIFSANAAERIQAIKRFDEVADEIIKKATIRNLNLDGGIKQGYYFPSIDNANKGIIVLVYNEKKSTMMLEGIKYFNGIE